MGLRPGDLVERYVVEAVLGEGGQAVVYRVRHTTLGTVHALKVLHVVDRGLRERFLQEGRLQAQVRHPNIVAVTDVLEVEGAPALLMELIEGGSLDAELRAGRPSMAEAERLFRGILAGVGYCHGRGMVHRDLKPANVLLASIDGATVAKVADFGLAKVVDADPGAVDRTRAGVVMGTPAYMAPEQLRDARSVDARADVFALGAILYELSTGRRAFPGGDLRVVQQAVAVGRYVRPESLAPDIPAAWVGAIDGALAPDREARIPDVATLLGVFDGTPFTVSPAARADTWDAGAPAASLPPLPAPVPAPAPAPVPSPRVAEPVASRVVPWRLLALAIPLVMAITRLSAPFEVWADGALLRAARGELPVDDAVVIAVRTPADLPALRPRHPALIDALVAAGAVAIAFDLSLTAPSDNDGPIAAAIARAEAAGVPVILPVKVSDERAVPPGTPALGSGRLGLVEFQVDQVFGAVRRAPIRRITRDGTTYWHLAAEAARADLHAASIAIDEDTLVIGGTRNPLWADEVYLHPTGPVPIAWYDDPTTYAMARGKVAIIGAYGGIEDLHRTMDGPRYGAEIHAAMVETLLRQAAVQITSPEQDAAIVLGTGGATAALVATLAGRARWLAGLVPLAFLALVAALARAGIVVAMLPPLLAAGIAAWATAASMVRPSVRARTLAAVAAGSLLAGRAEAGGVVEGIAVQDAAGRWHSTDTTTAAVRVRGTEETPLEKGMALDDGDMVRTALARVDIRDDHGVMHIGEGSRVHLGPTGVLDQLGDVYYRVSGAFSVQYATVEATVEGTRFRVQGPAEGATDPVVVAVDAGVVHVTGTVDDVHVHRGQRVSMPLEGAAAPMQAWGLLVRARELQSTWRLGHPRVVVGGNVSPGLLDTAPSLSAHAFVRAPIALGLNGTVAAGGGSNGDRPGFRIPAALSLDLGFAHIFAVGGSFTTAYEDCACPGEGGFRAVHLGGAGYGRMSLPLGRRVYLEGALDAGWSGVFALDASVGLGVGL